MANSLLNDAVKRRTTPRPVDTRLVPPKAPRQMIAREPLLGHLMDARRRRCVVLQGPAGCGKSTLLVAWRQALLPLGFDVAWLTLSPREDEPTSFVDALLASLGKVDARITREAALLADPGLQPGSVERVVVALVRGVANHGRELVLMLDDVHHLGNAAVRATLQWLLDFATPNLHLVLASRGTVPLSLARPRADGQTLELDLRDLRFSPEESQRYLEVQLGAEVAAREAQRLHELTDGWAAGLQLLALHWKRRRPSPARFASGGLPSLQMQDARGFVEYFEREVLGRLSQAELNLLVSAAACERFCAPLCAALDGRPGADAEAVALLEHLEHDNLFVVPVDSSEPVTWYRPHPLLHETLRARLAQRDEPAQRGLHARAWRWFRDHGLLDEAVSHALQAAEGEAAAGMVEHAAKELSSRGELRRLFGLLSQLPPAQIEARIDLRLWTIRLQLSARELDACAASIARLQAEIDAMQPQHRFVLTLMRTGLAVQRDDSDAALAVLPELLDIPEGLDAQAIGGRNNLLSWLYMQRGEYERARQVQTGSPALLVEGLPLLGTASGSLQGRCLIGLSHALQGDMAQAERVYSEVLREAEPRGRACREPACLAAALLGEALYERNDLAGVRRLLAERVDVLERASIPDSVLRVMVVLAATHWVEGAQLESFAYLERLEDYAEALGLDRLLAHSLYEQVRRRLELQDFEPAETALLRIESIAARHPQPERGALGEIALLAQRSRLNWCLVHGDLEAAAVRVAPLIAICEERGDHRLTAQLQLQAAVIDQRRERRESARRRIEVALGLGLQFGLVRSLLDVDGSALALMQQVADAEGFDPVLGFHVERLQAAARAVAVEIADTSQAKAVQAGSLAVAPEALSDRETAVMRLLAQAMSNKRIARTLSVSPETVKWHLRNIYGKFGVTGRDGAIERFRDLGSAMRARDGGR